MDCCKVTKKLEKTTDILTDGDIQSHPGPKIKIKRRGNLHIMTILIAAILIINRVHNWKGKNISAKISFTPQTQAQSRKPRYVQHAMNL